MHGQRVNLSSLPAPSTFLQSCGRSIWCRPHCWRRCLASPRVRCLCCLLWPCPGLCSGIRAWPYDCASTCNAEQHAPLPVPTRHALLAPLRDAHATVEQHSLNCCLTLMCFLTRHVLPAPLRDAPLREQPGGGGCQQHGAVRCLAFTLDCMLVHIFRRCLPCPLFSRAWPCQPGLPCHWCMDRSTTAKFAAACLSLRFACVAAAFSSPVHLALVCRYVQ